MEVAFISHADRNGYGGIAKYSDHFILGLNQIKTIKKISVFSRTGAGDGDNEKVKNYFYKNKIILFLIANISLFVSSKIKIIFVSHINLLPCALLAIFNGKKVILLTYGLEIWGFKKNFIYRWIIKKINFFICMREYTKKILIKKYKLKNKFLFDLHNALEFRNFKINNKKTKDLITVARLDSSEKYKGIDETLEILSKFKKVNFKYHIVGDGDDKMRLMSKAKKLSCSKNIIFHGKVSDRKRNFLLNSSHIMVMPGSDTTFDTYPFRFSFLEAAEFGLHIIGSDPPSIKEKLYQNNYSSLNFIKPKNKQDFINLIQKLHRKKKKKDAKLQKDFSIKNFKSNLNNIIIQIISK
jgi:hypothetical protein